MIVLALQDHAGHREAVMSYSELLGEAGIFKMEGFGGHEKNRLKL